MVYLLKKSFAKKDILDIKNLYLNLGFQDSSQALDSNQIFFLSKPVDDFDHPYTVNITAQSVAMDAESSKVYFVLKFTIVKPAQPH